MREGGREWGLEGVSWVAVPQGLWVKVAKAVQWLELSLPNLPLVQSQMGNKKHTFLGSGPDLTNPSAQSLCTCCPLCLGINSLQPGLAVTGPEHLTAYPDSGVQLPRGKGQASLPEMDPNGPSGLTTSSPHKDAGETSQRWARTPSQQALGSPAPLWALVFPSLECRLLGPCLQ